MPVSAGAGFVGDGIVMSIGVETVSPMAIAFDPKPAKVDVII